LLQQIFKAKDNNEQQELARQVEPKIWSKWFEKIICSRIVLDLFVAVPMAQGILCIK
jgi:hypothetical protein